MLRLAVIPNDPLDLYLSSGYGAEWLRAYLNPQGMFDEVFSVFSWADCMCNPSRWEGMSIVLIEALAAGTILVVSNVPEIVESVTDRYNGVVVADYENPAALADAIHNACTNQDLRHTIRANARPSVERFERSRIDALEASYYRRVLELRDAGAFVQPFSTRVRRAVVRNARQVLPAPLKSIIRPLIRRWSAARA